MAARRGSVAWVRECLAVLGVEGEARGWTIAPVRSSFFSDRPGSEDWRDRWPAAWVCRVDGELDRVAEPDPWRALPVYLDVIDDSVFEPGDDGADGDQLLADEPVVRPALVIAGRRAQRDAVEGAIPSLVGLLDAHGFAVNVGSSDVHELCAAAVAELPDHERLLRDLATGGAIARIARRKLDTPRVLIPPLHVVRVTIDSVTFPDQEGALASVLDSLREQGWRVDAQSLDQAAVDAG
jgi:hypothetical protein